MIRTRTRTLGRTLVAACLALLASSAFAAPTLVSSQPANNATGVATTTALVFAFSEPMADVGTMSSIPPFLVGNFDTTPTSIAESIGCEWSADARTLTCTPADPIPDNTRVTWTLNPGGTPLPYTGEDGTPLATVSGSFTTGTGTGGGGGSTAPKIVSVTPADGSTDVAVSSTITFIFDQAMAPNPLLGGSPPFVKGAVSWSIDASKFTYAWSPDSKTLTVSHTLDLPGNTLVTWNINPSGALLPLTATGGKAVAATSGSFTTGTGSGGGNPDCTPNNIDPTLGSYSLSRLMSYVQTSIAPPVPAADTPFSFGAFVSAPQAGPSITAGSVTLPNGTRTSLVTLPFGGMLYLMETNATAEGLITAYPGGSYTLRMTPANQSELAVAMSLPAANPTTPRVLNYNESQIINATTDFLMQWDAFAGATANDQIHLSIRDASGTVLFQAPDYCVPRALAPTATSIVIPANTLKENTAYTGELMFGKASYYSTNAVPKMGGYGGANSTTTFSVRTSGGVTPPPAPAQFTAWELLPNGHPRLTLKGTANRTYTIQRASPTFPNPSWQDAGTFTPGANGSATFEDSQLGQPFPLIYRAVGQ